MEFKEQLKQLEFFRSCIRLGKSRLDELLDEVESERGNIKVYQEELGKLKLVMIEEQIRSDVLSKEISIKNNIKIEYADLNDLNDIMEEIRDKEGEINVS